MRLVCAFLMTCFGFFGHLATAANGSSDFENSDYYYGYGSSEVTLKFEHFIEVETGLTGTRLRTLIDKQLTYMFGSLSSQANKAVPKGDHKILVTRSEVVEAGGVFLSGLSRVYYQYEGTLVLEGADRKSDKGAPLNYSFALPRNPKKIYQSSLSMTIGKTVYGCNSDTEHTAETYFWYFWDPQATPCPMVKGRDYDMVSAVATPRPNTKLSFPEYSRLARQGVIRIDILMGLNDESQSTDPFKSTDIAAGNFRDLHSRLLRMGYQASPWALSEIQTVAPHAQVGSSYVESLTKQVGGANVEVRFFFGPTSTYSGLTAFDYFMKDALANSSVYIYAGHSGLGEYLDLAKIESLTGFKFVFDQSRYQIYFFNGCSSYPYYNSMYFERKGGTHSLDILTNGLSTYFSSITSSSMSLITAVDAFAFQNKATSYQEIVRRGDSNNLLGVNGDEDNPMIK